MDKRTRVESLPIAWPNGHVDKRTDVPIDKIVAVKDGVGIVSHPFPTVPSR